MNKVEAKIKRLYITYYGFLFLTHLFSLIFSLSILDGICSPKSKEKKFPGIEIKEFR